jgi:hypothetical protein
MYIRVDIPETVRYTAPATNVYGCALRTRFRLQCVATLVY